MVLIGAAGSLGTVLRRCSPAQYSVIPVTRTSRMDGGINADMADWNEASTVLDKTRPDIIVNLAALTDVDACEQDEDRARRLNVDICRNLASWCNSGRNPATRLVHISTDQVYSGEGPHDEAAPAPINAYARTKLEGETAALAAGNAIVLRTNFFNAGPGVDRGLAAWLIRSLAASDPIRLFDDILFNPLYAGDLAEMILDLAQSPATGVFNLGASSYVSKAGFGKLLAQKFGLSLDHAVVAQSQDSNLVAARPKDMRMKTKKISAFLKHGLPSVEQGVDNLFRDTEAAGWQPLEAAHV